MKLQQARALLESEIRSQFKMDDFVLRADKDHVDILQVKLGEAVEIVAARMIRKFSIKGV